MLAFAEFLEVVGMDIGFFLDESFVAFDEFVVAFDEGFIMNEMLIDV